MNSAPTIERLADQAERVRRTITNMKQRASLVPHPRGTTYRAALIRTLHTAEQRLLDVEDIIADWPEAATRKDTAS